MVDRVAAQRDPLDRQHRKALDFVVVPGVVAERAFGGRLITGRIVRIGPDEPFEHDLGRGRHLQVVRQTPDDLRAAAAQQAGELILRQRVRHWRHRAENGRGIGAERHRDRKRRSWRVQRMVAKIQRTTPHAEPAHDHLVPRNHLLPVDAEVLSLLVRPARDGEAPRDQRAGIARPAGLHRQAREIDVRAFPDDVLARPRRALLGRHVEHLHEHRPRVLPRVLEALWRIGLLQEGQQTANFAQRRTPVVAIDTHRARHALRRAEQIAEHRDRAAAGCVQFNDRPLEQQRGTASL